VIGSEIAGTDARALDVRSSSTARPSSHRTRRAFAARIVQDRIEWFALRRDRGPSSGPKRRRPPVTTRSREPGWTSKLADARPEVVQAHLIFVNKWDLAGHRALGGRTRDRRSYTEMYETYLRKSARASSSADPFGPSASHAPEQQAPRSRRPSLPHAGDQPRVYWASSTGL